MENPKKLATGLGIQREEQQYKNTTQYASGSTMGKQTQITYASSYKEVEVMTYRTPFYVEFVTDVTTRKSEHEDL